MPPIVPASFSPVQQGSIQYNNPVSEASMDGIAGPINGLLSIMAPVGTVWASMLTQTQFQTQIGNPSPSTWVLCDGRDVTDSTYATVTGNNTIPDLRGIMIRGKNDGRADGDENPDGDLSLGTYTADRNASHTHEVADPGHNHAYRQGGFGGDNQTGASPGTYGNNGSGTIGTPDVETASTGIVLENQGGNDAAPKNITMNWFIRIN